MMHAHAAPLSTHTQVAPQHAHAQHAWPAARMVRSTHGPLRWRLPAEESELILAATRYYCTALTRPGASRNEAAVSIPGAHRASHTAHSTRNAPPKHLHTPHAPHTSITLRPPTAATPPDVSTHPSLQPPLPSTHSLPTRSTSSRRIRTPTWQRRRST